MRRALRAQSWWLSLVLGSLLAGAAFAGEDGAELESLDDPSLRTACEQLDARRSPQAADAWTALSARRPSDSQALWRAARAHHRNGDRLPVAARTERLESYGRARAEARRGRTLDPSCGECCLYEFAALGRIISIGGIAASARQLGEMASLVDVCLANPPRHADSPRNQELANLWYGLAGYYRGVPDSRWLQLITGARGDPDQAVDYVQRAVATAPDRIDYQVELGASLLCLGERRDDASARARGAATLQAVAQLPVRDALDATDAAHADKLLARPDEACGYTRDLWPRAQEVLVGSTALPASPNTPSAQR